MEKVKAFCKIDMKQWGQFLKILNHIPDHEYMKDIRDR